MGLRITTQREDLIENLSARTKVYDPCILNIQPLQWPVGRTEWLYGKPGDDTLYELDAPGQPEEFWGYRLAEVTDYQSADTLPVEFFNHQLMEVDVEDPASVDKFIQEWGFPAYRPTVKETAAEIWIEGLYGGEFPYKGLAEAVPSCSWTKETIVCCDGSRIETDSFRRKSYISYREAREILAAFQLATRYLGDLVARRSPDTAKHACCYLSYVLNSFAECTPILGFSHTGDNELNALSEHLSTVIGSLTAAIANQMLDAVADEAPWRECACAGCGNVFKRKQTKAGKKPAADSIYCCDRCEQKQRKRNQRAAAKARAQK